MGLASCIVYSYEYEAVSRLFQATFVAVATVAVPAAATVIRRIRHASALVAVPLTARPMYETLETVSLWIA
jgi:hypothetical protein